MPIQTYLKVFWEFKAQIGYTDRLEIHLTQNL
jgi:hypothetical protein